MAWIKTCAGLSVALAVSLAAPANAQSVSEALNVLGTPLFVPSSTGAWSVKLTSCAATFNGVAAASCGNESMVASVSGSVLSLVLEGTNNGTGGTNFLYNTGTGGQTDLSLNLVVTAPSGSEIYLASNSLSASSTPSGNAGVTSAETFSSPAENGLNVGLASSLSQSAVFSPVTNSISASTDTVAGYGAFAVTVPTVTLTYNAPEPVSSSLLAVGLAGLGYVRRKTRRVG